MEHGHRPWFTLSTPSISHAPGATAALSKGTTLVWVIEKAFFIFVTQSVGWLLRGSYVWPTGFLFFLSTFLSFRIWFCTPMFFFLKVRTGNYIGVIITLKWRKNYLTDMLDYRLSTTDLKSHIQVPVGVRRVKVSPVCGITRGSNRCVGSCYSMP